VNSRCEGVRLGSAAEDGGRHSGVAFAVHHGYDAQWLFVWRVGDEIVAYEGEAERSSGQVPASVILIWKRDKGFDFGENFLDRSFSGPLPYGGGSEGAVDVVGANELQCYPVKNRVGNDGRQRSCRENTRLRTRRELV
jgi:hypothetical protein